MSEIKPISQTKLFGLERYLNELIKLENLDKLPNKFLFSGQKGIGKSTLAYHFINYVLSKDETLKYDSDNFKINPENHSFKTVKNFSNPNLILIDVKDEKFNIDINQIRDLILKLNQPLPTDVTVLSTEFNISNKFLSSQVESIFFIDRIY